MAVQSHIMTPAKRLLNLTKAAAYCGVGTQTFKTHARITPVRIGSALRYDVRSIDKWINAQSDQGQKTGDEWLGELDEN